MNNSNYPETRKEFDETFDETVELMKKTSKLIEKVAEYEYGKRIHRVKEIAGLVSRLSGRPGIRISYSMLSIAIMIEKDYILNANEIEILIEAAVLANHPNLLHIMSIIRSRRSLSESEIIFLPSSFPQ